MVITLYFQPSVIAFSVGFLILIISYQGNIVHKHSFSSMKHEVEKQKNKIKTPTNILHQYINIHAPMT